MSGETLPCLSQASHEKRPKVFIKKKKKKKKIFAYKILFNKRREEK